MSRFRLRETAVVVSEAEYRAMHPDKFLPPVLSPDDADPVFETPRPTATATQQVVELAPVQDGLGNWVQAWELRSYGSEQVDSLIAESKRQKIKAIDDAIDQIMKDCIGERATEYQRAENQARAYKAAGYTGTVPPTVKSWAETKGWTSTQAADDIITQADAWIGAQDAMRDKRLKAKEAIRVATTLAQIDAAYATWLGFVSYIRNALGI